jgi:hypothetical protein
MDASSIERACMPAVRYRTRGVVAWLAVALLGVFAIGLRPAFAACDNTDYDRKIDTYYAQDCLPPTADVRKRVTEQRKRFFTDAESPEVFIAKAQEGIQKLKADVALHADQNGDIRKYFDTLQTHLQQAEQKLQALPSVDMLAIKPADFEALLPNFWTVNSVRRNEAGGLPAIMLSDSGCTEKTPPDAACDTAFQKVITVADDVFVANNLMLDLHSEQRARFITDATLRRDRWHAYLYDTQFQFWWELAFNRYEEWRCPRSLTARLADLVNKKCHAQAQDAFGNLLGFREVPDYRAILLHPDIGVGYMDEEPDGQRFKPLLVFQWIGFQWWKWDRENVSGLRGVSLVSTVADTSVGSRTGVGLQFQYGAFSMAFTSHSGNLAVTLNTGLINELGKGKVSQKWADNFKAALENPP